MKLTLELNDDLIDTLEDALDVYQELIRWQNTPSNNPIPEACSDLTSAIKLTQIIITEIAHVR